MPTPEEVAQELAEWKEKIATIWARIAKADSPDATDEDRRSKPFLNQQLATCLEAQERLKRGPSDIGLNFVERFKSYLKKDDPNLRVDDVVIKRLQDVFYNKLLVATEKNARELYDLAKKYPGSRTIGVVRRKEGIAINGPWDGGSEKAIFTAEDCRKGILKVVKLLGDQPYCNDSAQSPEEVAVRALCGHEQSDKIPIVSARIIDVEITGEDAFVAKRVPGHFKAILMEHFVKTAAGLIMPYDELVSAGLERIIAALRRIHSNGFVHMDVTNTNIFIDSKGLWYLGDFDCTVRTGEPIVRYSRKFYPTNLIGRKAEARYDFYMLAVAAVCRLDIKGADAAIFDSITFWVNHDRFMGYIAREFKENFPLTAQILQSQLIPVMGGGD